MRALDEVAEAIYRARGSRLPIVSAVGIEEQFGGPLTSERWDVLRQYLACALPSMWYAEGRWFLPDGVETIWDIVDYASRYHPDLEPPTERTEVAWREGQIFAGVKSVLIDALSIDSELVTRQARLKRDLGAE